MPFESKEPIRFIGQDGPQLRGFTPRNDWTIEPVGLHPPTLRRFIVKHCILGLLFRTLSSVKLFALVIRGKFTQLPGSKTNQGILSKQFHTDSLSVYRSLRNFLKKSLHADHKLVLLFPVKERNINQDDKMKCGFTGCKKRAIAILCQTVGKRQSLASCDKHTPQWAKNGKGSPFYTVKPV